MLLPDTRGKVDSFGTTRSEYKKKRQRPLQLARQLARQLAHDPKNIEAWFLSLCQLLHEFGISEGDMYNYDESGFMVDYGRSQWIVTKAPDRQSYLASSQNRETVTVGETISGDGEALPPLVVLPGQLHLEGWINNELDDDVLMAVSDSGYTNDEISLAWFEHFDKFSAKRQTGAWRLLLLDGHGPHATKDFLDYGDDHKILLYYLPPHATHFLQPLDVVVFQPYKHWHAEAVDAATRTGCTNFNKVEFLAALQSIRLQTLQKSTVLSAWRQTGLIPWNPNLVIDRLQAYAATQPRTPSPPQETPPQTVVETHSTTRALRSLAMQLVDDNQLDLNNATIRRFLKGSLKQAEAGNLALDYLSRTQAAEKAREQRHAAVNRSQVLEYLGIPYAQPPVGSLRFAAPAQYAGKGRFIASNYSAICPETPSKPVAYPGATPQEQRIVAAFGSQLSRPQSEDCLTLNVWTKPTAKAKKGDKPVLVFFYGGRWSIGGTDTPFYNGQYLADAEDVVVVTVNFRINIFGWPGAPGVSKNIGLLDQRLAVEWVRDNIKGFGGDASKIVIFGQSSGSVAVDFWSYAYADDPIVSGYISHSGNVFSFPTNTEALAEQHWYNASAMLGCGTSGDVLPCMRSKNFSDIKAAAAKVKPPVATSQARSQPAFQPTIDNVNIFSVDEYASRSLAGNFSSLPYMFGNNDNEAGYYKIAAYAQGVVLPDAAWDA
ncbi:hypothetical protein B0A49_07680, partial [Cryomyces minteri]